MPTIRRVLLILAGVLLPALVLAAVVPNAPIFPQVPKRHMQRFVTADPIGTYKIVLTGNNTVGTNQAGTRCHGLSVISDDPTTPHQVYFRINSGGLVYPGPVVNVGTTQVPVSVLNNITWPGLPPDSDGGYFLYLEPGQVLEATYVGTISSGSIIAIHADCWDF